MWNSNDLGIIVCRVRALLSIFRGTIYGLFGFPFAAYSLLDLKEVPLTNWVTSFYVGLAFLFLGVAVWCLSGSISTWMVLTPDDSGKPSRVTELQTFLFSAVGFFVLHGAAERVILGVTHLRQKWVQYEDAFDLQYATFEVMTGFAPEGMMVFLGASLFFFSGTMARVLNPPTLWKS